MTVKSFTFRALAASAVLLGSSLGLAGCTAMMGGESGVGGGGGFFAPQIISSTPRSVSVRILGLHNEADALRVAQEHCQQHDGRHAQLVQDRGDGRFNYACVE